MTCLSVLVGSGIGLLLSFGLTSSVWRVFVIGLLGGVLGAGIHYRWLGSFTVGAVIGGVLFAFAAWGVDGEPIPALIGGAVVCGIICDKGRWAVACPLLGITIGLVVGVGFVPNGGILGIRQTAWEPISAVTGALLGIGGYLFCRYQERSDPGLGKGKDTAEKFDAI